MESPADLMMYIGSPPLSIEIDAQGTGVNLIFDKFELEIQGRLSIDSGVNLIGDGEFILVPPTFSGSFGTRNYLNIPLIPTPL